MVFLELIWFIGLVKWSGVWPTDHVTRGGPPAIARMCTYDCGRDLNKFCGRYVIPLGMCLVVSVRPTPPSPQLLLPRPASASLHRAGASVLYVVLFYLLFKWLILLSITYFSMSASYLYSHWWVHLITYFITKLLN